MRISLFRKISILLFAVYLYIRNKYEYIKSKVNSITYCKINDHKYQIIHGQFNIPVNGWDRIKLYIRGRTHVLGRCKKCNQQFKLETKWILLKNSIFQ